MIKNNDLTVFYNSMESIVRGAGVKIRNAKLTDESVHQKDGLANFVTNFDVEVQRFLISRFKELLPQASFFGEEDTEDNRATMDEEPVDDMADANCGEKHNTSGYCFYIDPIDGTTNFIFGYQHSCVSVGLSYQNQMIAGFVYNPYTDSMYKAVRGQGAFLNDRPLYIQDKLLSEGIVSFGCARYNEGDTNLLFATVKELYLHSLSVRNGGSAALDLCRAASGANVIYLELKLQPYDYAAASVIIEEAGGEIKQVDGSPITLDKPCSILAGTTTACEEVRAVIERIRKAEEST